MFPPNKQTTLSSGDAPPPPLKTALDNAMPSYGTFSSGTYSRGQIPYAFGSSNSTYNTPDPSFTPAPFDTALSFNQGQRQGGAGFDFEAFDAENFDIWPQEMFEGINLGTGLGERDGQRDASEAMILMSRQPVPTPLTLPATSSHASLPPPTVKTTRKHITPHCRKSSTKSIIKNSPRSLISPSRDANGKDSAHDINHNQIEKKYPTSMNDRYIVLQAALPETILRSDEDGKGVKRVGKADVLVAALKYVKELEEKGRELEAEKLWEKRRGG